MCILFFLLSENPEKDGYRLILANNRDEYWKRQTAPIHFWNDCPNCIGSLDQEPGREGGTWLGMSTEGKFGILLNILAHQDANKKGRGFLVKDYLTSEVDHGQYTEELVEEANDHNAFRVILMDIKQNKISVVTSSPVETNSTKEGCRQCSNSHNDILQPGYHSFDNALHGRSWQKKLAGQKKFEELTQKYRKTEDRENLVTSLMDLLCDKTQHLPDPCLTDQWAAVGRDTEWIEMKERSAIFVWSPTWGYGTRTNTVILVDAEYNCFVTERTMTTPVDLENPHWTTVEHSFKLKPR